MKHHMLMLGAGLLCVSSVASAASPTVLASEGFDAGTDGWQAVNGSMNYQWQSSGGNPGGYVSGQDASGTQLWFFAAPAGSGFIGDLTAAYGGTLSFSERLLSINPTTQTAQVQIVDGGGSLLSFHSNSYTPEFGWTSLAISLSADAGGGTWSYFTSASSAGTPATASEMMSVLSDVTAFRILGDYRSAGEITGLDSISLTAAVVPEPASSALMLIGTLGLTMAVRQGRKSGGA
jgi:hypothetical protein